MENIYSYLKKNKDNQEIIYEIIPDKEDKQKELVKHINNLDINPYYKKFFTEQLDCRTGKYSRKDLYNLVNEYISKLQINNCPYNNYYPILIDEKTYISNIALFIACLKLNLKPILIDKDYIKELTDEPLIKDHCFGVCSSGSVKKKLINLSEEELISISLRNKDFLKGTIYSSQSIAGISGLNSSIVNPLIYGNRVIINNSEHILEDLEKYDVVSISLPLNWKDYINSIYLTKDKITLNPNIKSIILSGGYYSPLEIELFDRIGITLDKLFYLYGQTEAYSPISMSKLSDSKVIVLDLFDIINNTKKPEKILGLNLEINRVRELIDSQKTNVLQSKRELDDKFSSPLIKIGIKKRVLRIYEYVFSSLENGIDFILRRKSEDIRIKSDESNNYLQNEIHFISLGNIKGKNITLLNKPYGEITVNGQLTGDIGYIDDDENLYILYRKNKPESLLTEYIKFKYGVTSVICDDENDNKILCIENSNDMNILELFHIITQIKQHDKEIIKFFNIKEIYIDDIRKSQNLKKSLSSKVTKNLKKINLFYKNYSYILYKFIKYTFGNISDEEIVKEIDNMQNIISNSDDKEVILGIFEKADINTFLTFASDEFIESPFTLNEEYFNVLVVKNMYISLNSLSEKIIEKIFTNSVEENKIILNKMEEIAKKRMKELEEYFRNEHKSKSI